MDFWSALTTVRDTSYESERFIRVDAVGYERNEYFSETPLETKS